MANICRYDSPTEILQTADEVTIDIITIWMEYLKVQDCDFCTVLSVPIPLWTVAKRDVFNFSSLLEPRALRDVSSFNTSKETSVGFRRKKRVLLVDAECNNFSFYYVRILILFLCEPPPPRPSVITSIIGNLLTNCLDSSNNNNNIMDDVLTTHNCNKQLTHKAATAYKTRRRPTTITVEDDIIPWYLQYNGSVIAVISTVCLLHSVTTNRDFVYEEVRTSKFKMRLL